MKRGRCIPHTAASMSRCNPIRDFHFNSVPADYVLVYQYSANITSIGHFAIELTDSDMFHARPGDVIGWTFAATSLSGQIAYAAIKDSSNEAPEYEFPMVSEIGGKAVRANGLRRNIEHILSAHFNSKARFTLNHVYNSTGAYYITTSISPAIVVYVDEPISGVILQCPTLLATNSTYEITIPKHNGTNTTYEWLTGDGRLATATINGKYSLTYQKPGTYMFSLAAYNSLGRLTRRCTVTAVDKVFKLELLQPVGAVALGHETVISWKVHYGTNVSYTVDVGDGSTKKVFDMSGKSSNEVRLLYKYARIGTYSIKITAKNIISEMIYISAKAIVQIPLIAVKLLTRLPHITQNVYAAKGDEVSMWVDFQQGSKPICRYRFGDGTADKDSSELYVKHVYSVPGEYVPNVTCWNDISKVHSSLNATVIVQELRQITGLNLIAHPTSFQNTTYFSLELSSGSVYFCHWKFGDGASRETDFKMNQNPITHMYAAVGNYQAVVTCKNRLGEINANATISVDDPVTGIQIQCPKMYLRVGQPIELKASTQTGSRVQVVFNLGQGEELRTVYQDSKGSSVVTHSYSKPGYYNILVTAKNFYNSVDQRCPQIKVEYPVSGVRIISNSPLTFVPGIVKYSWFPSPDFLPPTDAVISWDYGDGHKVHRVPIDFKNLSTLIGTYKYSSTGVFLTKVQIENNVSSISFDLEIDVQRMLPVSLLITTKNPVTNQQVPGFGANGDFFALESELSLFVTKQPKDKWYFFDFGNGQTLNSSVEQIVYKYPSAGRYNITVVIENVLRRTTKWKVVTLQASIHGLTLEVASTVHLKTDAIFSIDAVTMGSSACYILTLGDGNVTVFNNSVCDQFVRYNTIRYEFKPLPAAGFKFSHRYAVKGKYTVSLEAKNVVSFKKLVKSVSIVYKPCAMPNVQISGGGSASSPRNILRSNRVVLRANVTFSCDKASHVLYVWSVYKAPSTSPIDSVSPSTVTATKALLPLIGSSGSKDPTIYEIFEKQLQLGTNAVRLTIKFESFTHDVSDVLGSSTVWFNAQATPLKAVVNGNELFISSILHSSMYLLYYLFLLLFLTCHAAARKWSPKISVFYTILCHFCSLIFAHCRSSARYHLAHSFIFYSTNIFIDSFSGFIFFIHFCID